MKRILKRIAGVEPEETGAVLIAFVYFFFLMASYFILRPLRDTMGTVYGVAHLQQLFTGTFIVSFIVAPIFAGLASRIRLATFLPWVYGFIGLTMLAFYALFAHGADNRWVAAAFFVWLSTFNILTISVFWSLMADIFSSGQAKRLFGFIAAGGTLGTIAAPAFITFFVKTIGTNTLLLISAAGFFVTAGLVRLLEAEKRKLAARAPQAQRTSLDRHLGGKPFDGFTLLFKSRYLMMIALFLLLMTWISTVIYFQLGDLISREFTSRAARTQAYANIDLAVNSAAVLIQLFGTGRFLKRFGVTAGLMLNPVIMVAAFLAVAFSPILLVLGGIQVARRVAEYAVAKPSRDMLFTVVDQQAKYKAKNVIDTVVYRFGDLTSSWVSAAVLPFGVAGLAMLGIAISAIWFPIAWMLGRRYESIRDDSGREA
ncbi:NTP/NDP exchange transporter [Achromobacter aloeverae]|uniref:MFS transporter n=1 Tax=Achromobacter aloeverae TaxID=1750518 RepID=A0A4Q1HQD0_9BURK|nr:MFS transporter [Achromobacter aloeverae]RXN93159.1 MFS transporter [Achromobacter aloeverae]